MAQVLSDFIRSRAEKENTYDVYERAVREQRENPPANKELKKMVDAFNNFRPAVKQEARECPVGCTGHAQKCTQCLVTAQKNKE
jgi:hypothetical protein